MWFSNNAPSSSRTYPCNFYQEIKFGTDSGSSTMLIDGDDLKASGNLQLTTEDVLLIGTCTIYNVSPQKPHFSSSCHRMSTYSPHAENGAHGAEGLVYPLGKSPKGWDRWKWHGRRRHWQELFYWVQFKVLNCMNIHDWEMCVQMKIGNFHPPPHFKTHKSSLTHQLEFMWSLDFQQNTLNGECLL